MLKRQIVVDRSSKKILASSGGKGTTHDLKLLANSGIRLQKGTWMLGDSGYQGYQRIHENTLLPFKKSKHNPLTESQKRYNKMLSSDRVVVEHVIRMLKRFKILADRYRNRRKRFGLRFNLIAAIYNQELTL